MLYKCNSCDYYSNRKFNLQIHVQRKHDDVPNTKKARAVTPAVTLAITSKALQCDKCLKIFSSRAAKSRHKKNVKCKPSETVCQPVEPVVVTPTQQYPVTVDNCKPVVEDSLTAEQVLIRKLRDEIQRLKNENDRLRRRMQGFKDADKKKIAAEQGWKCNICCIELPFNYQIDHIIPISAGGLNDMSNGQALCVECHERKSCREKK